MKLPRQMLWCFSIVAVIATPLYPQSAPTPAATGDSCRQFVQQFYHWYLPTSQHAKGDPADLALKVKSSAFSPQLAKELKEDFDAQRKAKGDLVGLDFDPFLNSQDDGFEKCSAGNVVVQNASCRVDVSCNFPRQPVQKLVTPELQFARGHWFFVNFHYHIDSGDDDLLHILKGLREDRKPKSK